MANKQPIVISGGRLANIDAADTLDVPNLNIDSADPAIIISEHGTAPATPASGKVVLYVKSDGLLYFKDDAGVETAVGTGGGEAGGGPVWNPRLMWEEYTDLVGEFSSLTTFTSAGGTVSFSAGSIGHPGVVEISTASTAATSNGILTSKVPGAGTDASRIFVGGGELTYETLIEIPTLLDGTTNTGQYRCGFFDEITGAPTNGIHAQYDDTSPKWKLFCRSGGISASVVGTSDASDVGWHHIKIVVNAAGDSVELFVDGVSQGTLTTEIPTVGMGYGAQVQKTAGSTPAIMRVDMFHLYQVFSTPRWS